MADRGLGHDQVAKVQEDAVRPILRGRCRGQRATGGHKEMRRSKARGTDESARARWSEEAVDRAAVGGHLEVVQWLRQNGCPWSSRTCYRVAERGHLDILKWARSQGPPCPWDLWTCTWAAKEGHLDVLKWARSQDPPCPWDRETCDSAALRGNLDVLKFARGQDPPCPWSRDECRSIASCRFKRHHHIVTWIDQQEVESNVE